jgi:hypothetical protein
MKERKMMISLVEEGGRGTDEKKLPRQEGWEAGKETGCDTEGGRREKND